MFSSGFALRTWQLANFEQPLPYLYFEGSLSSAETSALPSRRLAIPILEYQLMREILFKKS